MIIRADVLGEVDDWRERASQPRWRLLGVVLLLGVLLPGGSRPALAPPHASPMRPAVAMPAPVTEVPPAVPAVTEPPAPPAAPPPAPPPAPGPRRLMLIGDSMAYTAAEGLEPHAPAFGSTVANEGIFGCGVVRGGPFRHFSGLHQADPRCEAWPALWQTALERHRPDMVGIMIGRWELMDRFHGGRWTNVFDPAFALYVETEVDHALDLAGSTGAKPVIFTTPYFLRGHDASGHLRPEDEPARVDAVNALFRRVAERRGVPVVDAGGWLSPGGRYTPEIGGQKVRSDGVHLTRHTGAVLAPWLFPQLQAISR